MNYPTKVIIENVKYPINTDFRVALECNRIAMDSTIGEYERALAIIYKLYGKKGLDASSHHLKLIELAKKYLSLNKKYNNNNNEEPDMDFEQDYDYIMASFMSDYQIDLEKTEMHWWTFFNLLNGLSNSELGNCCILNRIRNLRNYDTSQIKDLKMKTKIEKEKEFFSLHKKEKKITKKQKESIDRFNKLAGIE